MRLPRLLPAEQRLYSRRLDDIPAAVARACREAGLERRLRVGERVAITVGSRGIANIAAITAAVVETVKRLRGRPFIVPAMGTHGGGTAAGQRAVLASLGVAPGVVGAPVRASMAVARVGQTSRGVAVYMSREALRADHIILMNRVKQHSDFSGEYESGLMKMLAVGLGKREGAAAMHSRQCAGLREDMPEAARLLLARAPIAAGLAILENGYNDTADIVGLPPDEIARREPALLRRARRSAARLPFRDLDLLVVDHIGKDVSGVGLDPHVIGRRMMWGEPEFPGGPRIRLLAALDLTPGSHGNPLGVGLADLTTDRLVAKIDWAALKTNVLHTGWLNRAKLPLSFPSDRALMEAAMIAMGRPDPAAARVVRISDTLHLARLWISEGLAGEAEERGMRLLGRPAPMRFDPAGNLRGLGTPPT